MEVRPDQASIRRPYCFSLWTTSGEAKSHWRLKHENSTTSDIESQAGDRDELGGGSASAGRYQGGIRRKSQMVRQNRPGYATASRMQDSSTNTSHVRQDGAWFCVGAGSLLSLIRDG
jgi:hypothetical protein